MRVAINGFGRIGRTLLRILSERSDIEVAAINDIADNAGLAYLFKYDTVMGTFAGKAELEGDIFHVNGHKIRMTAVPELTQLPWRELGVDVVVEATGRFRNRAEIAKHLDAGARRVILTVPAKDEIDATVVLGVNDHVLKPEHRIVSNASCTTNCLAPVAKVLSDQFGIERGFMTTIHAYTNDQKILDLPHKDLRRARAAAMSMIPTSTGAAKAIGLVMPELKGKLDGYSMRVPTPDVSVVDLVAVLAENCTAEEVNAALKAAAEGELKGILAYTDDPVVSTDMLHNPNSSIVDGQLTKVLDGNLLKVVSWYDNEWGYSMRVVDLIVYLASKGL